MPGWYPRLAEYPTGLGAKVINPKITTWNYKRFAELQGQGVYFNVWTVTDDHEMEALIFSGVQGMITDFPQRLKKVLDE